MDLPENDTNRVRHKVPKLKLVDKLHRAVVIACIGVGGLSALFCGLLGVNYYINVRPVMRREALRKQQELLQEGSAFETENISEVS